MTKTQKIAHKKGNQKQKAALLKKNKSRSG